MFKFKPAFKNSYQGTSLPKFQKAVKDILKYGKMSVPEAKKFQAERQIFADSKKFANVLGDDKLRPKDLDKVLRHSRQQKTFEKWQTDHISEYLKKGGWSRKETAPKAQESEKTRKPSRIKTILQKIKEPKILSKIPNNKISSEVSKQGMSSKKTSASDTIVKEVKGFKTPKSGMSHAAFTPAMSYDFSGRDPKFDMPQEPDSEILYKALGSKTPQEQLDRKSPPEIPDWKLAAYDKKTPNSSKPSHLAESRETQNKDIDE